ncbi:Hypothetical predicted protein, partial [Olea europaea subsp. europaea]
NLTYRHLGKIMACGGSTYEGVIAPDSVESQTRPTRKASTLMGTNHGVLSKTTVHEPLGVLCLYEHNVSSSSPGRISCK